MGGIDAEWPPDRRAEFAAALPKRAQKFSDDVLSACYAEWGSMSLCNGIDVFTLVAVMERESGSGVYLTPRGSAGTGDGGHGHGLVQIDDRSHGKWLETHDWRIPLVNLRGGCWLLKENLDFFSGNGIAEAALPMAIVCGYNASPSNVVRQIKLGRDPNRCTTGMNYGSDVLTRAETWRSAFKGA